MTVFSYIIPCAVRHPSTAQLRLPRLSVPLLSSPSRMAQLLPSSGFNGFHLHATCSIICRSSCSVPFLQPTLQPKKFQSFLHKSRSFPRFSTRAFDTEGDEKLSAKIEGEEVVDDNVSSSGIEDEYPSGEFVYREYHLLERFAVKCKMLVAWPWQRVKKGSVLTMNIRGEISDQLKSRFSSGLSLPQISENFIKAAYDPRISGIYLHIEPLNCGWGKVEEIRRHILDFTKSGKFILGYVPACGEKEYYIGSACEELYAPPSAYFQLYGLTVQASFLGGVLENIGIEPQVQRIGKYKSAGDQLTRKNISDENREMLTALLDNIYENWVEKIALAKGKKKEEIENFVNEGVFEIERLKEDGWITDIKYDDEVISLLKERLEIPSDKKLPTVDYRKYCRVKKWTLGLTGSRNQIAIIRASGSISRVRGRLSTSSSGIVAEQFIEKIRTVRESKKYKAVVLRIDSPGGDALASDLMWREIKLLASSKPVIASMADVAASGGYYMAMAAQTIVAENLTLTGSIGVVTGKFNLEKLYERIGFNKEIISRGRYAEVTAAEQRPFRFSEGKRRWSSCTLSQVASSDLRSYHWTSASRMGVGLLETTCTPAPATGPTRRQSRYTWKTGEFRSLCADEAELFAKSAQNAYRSFRDKAASSRSMSVDKMEEVAQGRVWTGSDAASRGLVDAIGGLSRAVAIAKQKANLPLDEQVTLVELTKPSTSLPEFLSGFGSSLAEADNALQDFLQIMTSYDGIQARMDGIMLEQRDGASNASSIFTMIKNYLRSL